MTCKQFLKEGSDVDGKDSRPYKRLKLLVIGCLGHCSKTTTDSSPGMGPTWPFSLRTRLFNEGASRERKEGIKVGFNEEHW